MKQRGTAAAASLAAAVVAAVVGGGSPASAGATGATGVAAGSASAATSVPARTAAVRWLQPTGSITPADGCVVLSRGFNGVKVRLVQRRLGLGARWETMDSTTMTRVARFQRVHHLPRRDGVVDRRTWRAMNLRHGFCVDRWQAHPVALDSTRRQRVRAMIEFANRYRGSEYVWGGAGRPNLGVDCSGLVLQALYRAGLDPQPVSIDKHVRPRYRTSVALFGHDRLRHVPLANRRRGDLVFYRKDSTGDINHVAIYLGGNRMLQAKGENVHVDRVRQTYPGQTVAATVVRPFPLGG